MGKNVLIVDDSSIMRKMIRQTLESRHKVVAEAKSGQDAVELYKGLHPDIVTMDITMRDMDGFAAAREILNFDPRASIIFLSNLDEDQYSPDARKIGAKGFVNKHNAKDILELIDRL